jgi:hypothetical protein
MERTEVGIAATYRHASAGALGGTVGTRGSNRVVCLSDGVGVNDLIPLNHAQTPSVFS